MKSIRSLFNNLIWLSRPWMHMVYLFIKNFKKVINMLAKISKNTNKLIDKYKGVQTRHKTSVYELLDKCKRKQISVDEYRQLEINKKNDFNGGYPKQVFLNLLYILILKIQMNEEICFTLQKIQCIYIIFQSKFCPF